MYVGINGASVLSLVTGLQLLGAWGSVFVEEVRTLEVCISSVSRPQSLLVFGSYEPRCHLDPEGSLMASSPELAEASWHLGCGPRCWFILGRAAGGWEAEACLSKLMLLP